VCQDEHVAVAVSIASMSSFSSSNAAAASSSTAVTAPSSAASEAEKTSGTVDESRGVTSSERRLVCNPFISSRLRF